MRAHLSSFFFLIIYISRKHLQRNNHIGLQFVVIFLFSVFSWACIYVYVYRSFVNCPWNKTQLWYSYQHFNYGILQANWFSSSFSSYTSHRIMCAFFNPFKYNGFLFELKCVIVAWKSSWIVSLKQNIIRNKRQYADAEDRKEKNARRCQHTHTYTHMTRFVYIYIVYFNFPRLQKKNVSLVRKKNCFVVAHYVLYFFSQHEIIILHCCCVGFFCALFFSCRLVFLLLLFLLGSHFVWQ